MFVVFASFRFVFMRYGTFLTVSRLSIHAMAGERCDSFFFRRIVEEAVEIEELLTHVQVDTEPLQ